MPASGSAKPSDPPDPGDPNEASLPNGHEGLGFMNPSENRTSPFKHSSKKPCAAGLAGAANARNVSGRNRSSRPPVANTP